MNQEADKRSLSNGKLLTLHFSDSQLNKDKIIDFVSDWFTTRTIPFQLANPVTSRGVLLDFSNDDYLKIKGAGLNGGAIDSSKTHRSGPPYCHFDFEGKKMIDLSFGHDNAPRGGMSFTQAYAEFVMSRRIDSLVGAVPCVAWGRIDHMDQPPSWISVHLWPKHVLRPRAWRAKFPESNMDRKLFEESISRMLRLHFDHGIVGVSECAGDVRNRTMYSFDLHLHRQVNIDSSSAITMTCWLAWSLTIRRLGLGLLFDVPAVQEMMNGAYKAICPEVTAKEIQNHEYWAQVDLAGLSEGKGLTTRESWQSSYRHNIHRVLSDIKQNALSYAMYEKFAKTYPRAD